MAPSWSRRNPLSLVVVLTLALVGTLALAGALLVVALDGLYTNQLKANFAQDAERRADYLEQTRAFRLRTGRVRRGGRNPPPAHRHR